MKQTVDNSITIKGVEFQSHLICRPESLHRIKGYPGADENFCIARSIFIKLKGFYGDKVQGTGELRNYCSRLKAEMGFNIIKMVPVSIFHSMSGNAG
jgi:hypothetical protein